MEPATQTLFNVKESKPAAENRMKFHSGVAKAFVFRKARKTRYFYACAIPVHKGVSTDY